MDILKYTDNEIKKNLALLETHLKQAPFSDKLFCEECINKHILILEGLAEEGIIACEDCDINNYRNLFEFLNIIKKSDFQKRGLELAKLSRRLRKDFVACDEKIGMKDRDDIKEKINDLIEDLRLAEDEKSQDRISYGISLLNWVIKGRRCSDV